MASIFRDSTHISKAPSDTEGTLEPLPDIQSIPAQPEATMAEVWTATEISNAYALNPARTANILQYQAPARSAAYFERQRLFPNMPCAYVQAMHIL